MKSFHKLTITLLSGLILTACGGSGGKSVATAPSITPPLKVTKGESEHKTEEKPQPQEQPQKQEQPKQQEEPQQQEQPQEKMDNQAIFNQFNLNGGNFDANQWLTLQFDLQSNQIIPLSKKGEISSQQLHGLFDHQGRLLGYYGNVSMTNIKEDEYRPDEKIAEHYTFPMLEMDVSQKIRPTHDINYEGTFYYTYKDTPINRFEGRVAAQYREQDKRLSMELFGEKNEYWELKENGRKVGVNVAENGDVVGRVYDKNLPNATFNGAIYGQNGEVFSGTLEYDDYTHPQNSWKGVVGAKAK